VKIADFENSADGGPDEEGNGEEERTFDEAN